MAKRVASISGSTAATAATLRGPSARFSSASTLSHVSGNIAGRMVARSSAGSAPPSRLASATSRASAGEPGIRAAAASRAATTPARVEST
jgi:hypothetical protein